MILGFRDKETLKIWNGKRSKRLPFEVQKISLRKLLLIDTAESVDDLLIPPGNQLEKLTGDRAGQWSIRINKQWRICFKWVDGNAMDVEITDYH